MNIQKFEIVGIGSVEADLDNPNIMPKMIFSDGKYCYGLPRTAGEVMQLGYQENEIAKANFIHESIHLFLSYKLNYVSTSVGRLASEGETFTDYSVILEASIEERKVLGFQVYVQNAIGNFTSTAKLQGFTLHVAAALFDYARREINEKHNASISDLKEEFLSLLSKDLWEGELTKF
jgi:hypothetical protein